VHAAAGFRRHLAAELTSAHCRSRSKNTWSCTTAAT
jgi:hypothetical protein